MGSITHNKQRRSAKFDTEEMAQRVLNSMRECVDTYGYCTMADFTNILKSLSDIQLDISKKDETFGWKNLENVYVGLANNGDCRYVLKNLPAPLPIS